MLLERGFDAVLFVRGRAGPAFSEHLTHARVPSSVLGEQEPQKMSPQRRQWRRRVTKLKVLLQATHESRDLSDTHLCCCASSSSRLALAFSSAIAAAFSVHTRTASRNTIIHKAISSRVGARQIKGFGFPGTCTENDLPSLVAAALVTPVAP